MEHEVGLLVLRVLCYVHAHKDAKLAFAHNFELGFSHPCESLNTPASRFPKGNDMPM